MAINNLFKLDSNIDGTYIDSEKNVHLITDMIQAVGAVDGPEAYPSNHLKDVSFSPTEMSALNGYLDVTKHVNNKGHGILYDENGVPYANTGDLVFRDGLGNKAALSDMFFNLKSINQDENRIYLRDKTLQQYNTEAKGVFLDNLIDQALSNTVTYNPGNIVQVARNKETNKNSVAVQTITLSSRNIIWLVASAMVSKPSVVRLIDTTTNIVLTTSVVVPEQDNIVPVFLSWSGPVSNLTSVPNNTCTNPAIWNSYAKKFFKLREDGTNNAHEFAIQLVTPENELFIQASINMLCIDEDNDSKVDILDGNLIIKNQKEININFDEPLTSTEYSISIQPNDSIQTWYDEKTVNGFKIKFENIYNGELYWSAVLQRK